MGWRAELAKPPVECPEVITKPPLLPDWELGEGECEIESQTEQDLLARQVRKALQTLTPREERVLRLRFGIGCEEHTFEECGAEFGLTRERIRQIEAKAMRKLKHPMRAKLFGRTVKASYFRPQVDSKPTSKVYEPRTIGPHFDHIEDVKLAIDRRSILAVRIDSPEWEFVTLQGGTDAPEVCEPHNTDFVVLFNHGGQRWGERWQDIRTTRAPRWVSGGR